MKKSEFLIPVLRNRFKLLMKLCIMMLIVSFESAAFNYLLAQQPQTRTISGTVTDQKGGSLTGVTVMIKGTNIGLLTSLDGKYTLSNVPQNATLVFSFIGMVSQEVPVTNQTRIDVVLIEQTVSLQEVVVVGYGAQKKETIVGSISQTTNAKLQQTGGVTNLAEALTGQLPGVITLSATGEPGGSNALSTSGGVNSAGNSGTSVYIRGRNTWNGGQPLILIDGIERDMYNIDVNEVENISILKDASATAVFGVKGANGVILITTKRGTSGKTKISFDYEATGQMVSKLPERAGSYEAQQARNEGILREVSLNEGSWAEYYPYEVSKRFLPANQAGHPDWWWIYPNVDWEKAMFKDVGISQHGTLNVNGGTDFVKYFGSISYLNEGDMLRPYKPTEEDYTPSYGFRRFNFRSNLDFTLTKTTKLSLNISGYWSNKDVNMAWTQYNIGTQGQMWAAVYRMPPDLYLPRYPDLRWGCYPPIPHGQLDNPVAFAQNEGVNSYKTTQLNSDFALDQKLDFITKGLSARVQFYYDNVIYSRSYIYDYSNGLVWENGQVPGEYVDPFKYTADPNSEYISYYPKQPTGTSQFDWVNPIPSLSNEAVLPGNTERRMQYQFQLNYARNFGLNNVTALGGMKRQQYAMGSVFPSYREDWIFRVTYDYNSKYLFEVNGAYNGSEQFGPGYRFAFFPSLALGYAISNEKFWNIGWMNRLKFRYSIGWVGDDNVSGGQRWLYSNTFTYGAITQMDTQDINPSPYREYAQSTIGNPNIHWEKAKKSNFGLEMGLLKDMISINFDYFTEDRTDMLIAGSQRAVPSYFGGSPPAANLGHVKSSGEELEIKFDKRTAMGFHYWAAIAPTHTYNKIIFKDDPQLLYDYQKAAGHTINQTYSQIRANRYNNWDDIYASVPMETNDIQKIPGFWNIIDYNADGIIKSSTDGAPVAYSDIPQNTFNYTIGADYKGFSAMIQLYGVTNVSRSMSLQNYSNKTDVWFTYMRDYWSKDNQDGTSFIPRWRTSGGQTGDYWLFDASYWRIKTAEIAYTFPQKIVKSLGMSSLRVYLNGNNLYFWSRMLDDREGSFLGGSNSEGSYPTVKHINIGVQLVF